MEGPELRTNIFGMDGNPIYQSLRLLCGYQWEKCARAETIFHYCSFSPSREIHKEFMTNRPFIVLLNNNNNNNKSKNKANIWIKGKVVSWEEYNCGPLDPYPKWELTALMEPAEYLGEGALVQYHDDNNDDEKESFAIITKIEENNEYCTIATKKSSSISGIKLNDLKAYQGEMTFSVDKMNVQGGGVLNRDNDNVRYSSSPLPKTCFSMKWLESYDGKPGYFVAEKENYDASIMVQTVPRVQQFRDTILQKTREFAAENNNDNNSDEFHKTILGKLIYENILIEEGIGKFTRERYVEDDYDYGDFTSFQHALLAVPFIFLDKVVSLLMLEYEDKHSDSSDVLWARFDLFESDWCKIFHAIATSSMYLVQDKEWNDKFYHDDNFPLHQSQLFYESSTHYNIMTTIGEWFEKRKQFSAAIWCYSENLKFIQSLSSSSSSSFFDDTKKDECVGTQLSYLALAHKRMGNFVQAKNLYEESLKYSNGLSKRQQKAILSNCKEMQKAASGWFGNSGYITPFTTMTSDDEDCRHGKCSFCGKDGATKKCSACKLAFFCDVDCQKKSWKKIHTHTCLGKCVQKK